MATLRDKLEKTPPLSAKAKTTENDKTPYSEGTGIAGSKNADPKVLTDTKLNKGRVYGDLGAGSTNAPGYSSAKTYSSTIIKK
jgi:hypothetical protein